MSLELSIAVQQGDFDLEAELEVSTEGVTAVVGPNGAGKTTLLACIAGSAAVDAGSIRLGGRLLDAPPDTFVPPEDRHIGLLHQNHLLFPHLDLIDNVAFGLRAAGRTRRAARDEARGWLDQVGVGHLATRRPAQVSGGEAQRAALARALAPGPAALLLDEPLAALDAATRTDTRRELRRHLEGNERPTLLVTHDPVDALVLADRVVVLEGGRVTQIGSVADVAARPRSRYAADLVGTNLLRGDATGTSVGIEGGDGLLTIADQHHGPVFVAIPPAAVALHRRPPEGSPRNRWRSTVMAREVLGDRVRVQLGDPFGLVAEVTPMAAAELGVREGDVVWAGVKATEISTYPR